MTVVDSKYVKENATSEEREKNLRTMIKLALDSIKEGG
jgi:purine-nucleoside phosphorylase